MTLLQSISCSKTLEVDPDTTGLSVLQVDIKVLLLKINGVIHLLEAVKSEGGM